MSFINNFQSFIHRYNLFQPKDKLLLAVSGGVDSVVLCELCSQSGFDFAIAHCNFQLRGEESDRDEEFVKQLAAKYNVSFYFRKFDTKIISVQSRKSIEETARELRYQWFSEILIEYHLHWLLTAHHADDNIETVLMHFFRGTGIKGLRGMLPKHDKLIRPLLFARRKEIEAYARENNLEFVTDHTNAENAFTRNYFRNMIIPLVSKHFPGTEENILHNIDRFREIELLYHQSIFQHKKKLLEQRENEIHIPVLKLKKSEPLKTIIFEIIKDFDFTSAQVDEVIALLDSESGKYIESSSHRIIKNRNWVIIAPNNVDEANHIIVDDINCQVPIVDYGNLHFEIHSTINYKLQTSNSIAQLDAAKIEFPLIVRNWKQGDYFYPLGMKKKKKLARFFIDNKLSQTQKEKIRVIVMNKKIIWVIGMRIDERFKITPRTEEILKISFNK